jgi:hypothetical protein
VAYAGMRNTVPYGVFAIAHRKMICLEPMQHQCDNFDSAITRINGKRFCGGFHAPCEAEVNMHLVPVLD